MPAPLLHIATSQTLPQAADVVVIGGGIVGSAPPIIWRGAA